MATPTLRQLRYVAALHRHQHFGAAAEACAVTQPALSMQVRDLEDRLGLALFERGTKSVQPTAFGDAFAARARDILRAVDELDDFAAAERARGLGRLRLGVIPTVAPYLLPRIVGALDAAFPGLDLRLRETVTDRLLAELFEGRLDAALLALPVSEPALTETPLFDEAFVLVRPAADAAQPVPDGEDLARMRLLLLEEGHCFRDQALSFCSLRPGVVREGLDGSSLSTLVQMVAAGLGVTLIPEMAVDVETRATPVAVAHFPPPAPARQVGLVWRRTSPLAGALTQVADVIRAAMTPPAPLPDIPPDATHS